MHKSSVRFGKNKSEVRFGSGSAKNSWFGRFLVRPILQRLQSSHHPYGRGGRGTTVPSRKLLHTSCLQDADRTTFRAWKPHHYSMAPTQANFTARHGNFYPLLREDLGWYRTRWSAVSPFPLEPKRCNRPLSAAEFQHNGGLAPRFQCNDVLQQPQHMEVPAMPEKWAEHHWC